MSPRANENPTVYSIETGRVCPRCGKPQVACICKNTTAPNASGDGIVRVQKESKGRGGKVVTLVTGLNLDDDTLKKLAGELMRVCGAGGAIKDAVIEIQGDHRDALIPVLQKEGYRVKKVGG
jgi:translation initiation factor 1